MKPFTDEADDVSLPQRSRQPELRSELRGVTARPATQEDMADDVADDREVTLSTGTVLVLFFGLALICAVFFGFGYSMGKKSAAASAAVADTSAADSTPSTSVAESSAAKPSAGSPAIQAIPSYQGTADRSDGSATPKPATIAKKDTGTSVTLLMDAQPTSAAVKKPVVDDPDAHVVGDAAPARPVPIHITPATTPAPVSSMPAVAPGGTVYVQVAAVSHKEDADVLLSALKRRGYTVITRPSDADKLIHVQVGPFATKKDADAMRLRLQGDGYNAILK